MKKIVSLLLVSLMVCSLCACGNTNKPVENSPVSTTPIEVEEVGDIEEVGEVVTEGTVEIEDVVSVGEYAPLDVEYKMCKIDTIETDEAINHIYWVSIDKSERALKSEYEELEESLNWLWVYGYNTKDNCKVIDNYDNIRCYAEVSPNYVEAPPITDNNLSSGSGFLVSVKESKTLGENNMSMDDFSFILTIMDVMNNFEIKRAQYIKENCSVEEMGLKDIPLYSKNSIIQIDDSYYSITEPNFFATPNEADEYNTVGQFFTLTQVSSNGVIEDINLGTDFEIFDSIYMEPISYPEGTELKAYIDTVSINADGLATAKVIFEAHNNTPFDYRFITSIDECIVKCEINGTPTYIAIIK